VIGYGGKSEYNVVNPKKGWKACAISVSTKSVIISTALGGYIGNRVDVYEYENVLAFVNTTFGDYPTSPNCSE
jgi:hypothetical protein